MAIIVATIEWIAGFGITLVLNTTAQVRVKHPCYNMVQHGRICTPSQLSYSLDAQLIDCASGRRQEHPLRHLERLQHRSHSMHCAQRGHCASTRLLRQPFGQSKSAFCIRRAANRRQMATQAVLSNQTVAVTGASQVCQHSQRIYCRCLHVRIILMQCR